MNTICADCFRLTFNAVTLWIVAYRNGENRQIENYSIREVMRLAEDWDDFADRMERVINYKSTLIHLRINNIVVEPGAAIFARINFNGTSYCFEHSISRLPIMG